MYKSHEKFTYDPRAWSMSEWVVIVHGIVAAAAKLRCTHPYAQMTGEFESQKLQTKMENENRAKRGEQREREGK